MERHPVPQNIMDVEFKLFGALTIKQFAYLAGGFVVALLFYFADIPVILKLIFISMSVIVGAFLSLARINGQSSSTWLANYLVALVTSQERVWRKKATTPEVLQDDPALRTITQKRVDKLSEVTDARKLPQVPFAAYAQTEEDLKAENDEKQRLAQIDQHFDFMVNQLPKYGGKLPPITAANVSSRPAFVPQKKETKEEQTPVFNPTNQNLAGSYRQQPGKGTDVLKESPTFATQVKQMSNTQTNRPVKIIDQIIDEMDNSGSVPEAAQGQQEKTQTAQTDSKSEKKTDETVTNSESQAVVASRFSKANIIYGVVQGKEGKPLTKCVISIKDDKDNFIRKAFTGSNGYFSLTTPLANGVYYIDIVAEKYKFPRYTLNLNGKVLPGYKFVSE